MASFIFENYALHASVESPEGSGPAPTCWLDRLFIRVGRRILIFILEDGVSE